MGILDSRVAYKPLVYPWANELFLKQHKVHWLPDEIDTFQSDVIDWKKNLTEDEKDFIVQILRFFTQQDIDVAAAYCKRYLNVFQHPELVQMMTSFAAMEGIHVEAYSKVIDTLGLPESEYEAFLQYSEMKNKHDYLWSKPIDYFDIPEDVQVAYAKTNKPRDEEQLVKIYNLAFDIAKFTLAEGLQLFASFAMLMNFQRFNKMKAMGLVVEWSVK